MKDKNIIEMFYLVQSCKNNLNPKWNHKFDKSVEESCKKFCKLNKINVTHGSAYKELRHKTYYYINKNIESIINTGVDLYSLRKHKLVTDEQIVDKLIKIKLKNKLVIINNSIGFYM